MPKLSAQVWDGVAGGLNGGVHGFEVFDGKLIMGGSFKDGPSGPGGTKTGHIIEFDSIAFSSTINNYFGVVIRDLQEWNGDLVAVGDFWNPNTNSQPCVGCNGVARWDGVAWNPLGVGANNDVLCAGQYQGDLVVGGDFLEMDGIDSMQCIARWDTSWDYFDPYVSPNTVFDNDIRAMAVYNNKLYVGGDFNNASGKGSADGIARWDDNDTTFRGVVQPGGIDSTVRALYVDGTDLYIGGHFLDILGNTDMSGICRYDGTNFYPLGTGLNGYVRAIIKYHGEIYAGGDFTIAGGVAARSIARWDGTQWRPCGGGVDSGYVRAFQVYKDQLYVGGAFKKYDGTNTSSPYIARWTTPKPNVPTIPVGDLVINEFMADNNSTMADQDGEYDDWIELYNNSANPIQLQGVKLADNFGGVSSFTFPDTIIAPGDYIVVWADDQVQAGLHAPFKLGAGGEQVVLWDYSNNLIDSEVYGAQTTDVATGRFPNGTGPFVTLVPTFGAQNMMSTLSVGDLVINEFMAVNLSTMADQNGEFDDWIELYNTTSSPIDLDGFRLSDDLGNSTMWAFPDTVIAANGYLVVWADNQTQAGLHSNFGLGGGGEEIGLWDNVGMLLDSITFGAQSADITTGRFPNGTGPFMPLTPTFHAENTNAGASINYIQSNYCVNGTDPTPIISGTQGGTFSASPAGLVINSTTGAVDLSLSTQGVLFTISYAYATGIATDTITVLSLDDATFSYSPVSICENGSNATATVTGLAGGIFASTAGLAIDANTGLITASSSLPGTYNVSYTSNGTCPNTSVVSVDVIAEDDASFSYSTTSACQSGTDPVATIGGLIGGTFSSTAGLTINANTGFIDASTSTIGTYNVTYTTNGTCPNTSTVSVTITATDDASFSYSTASVCQSGTDPVATITGLTGGTFSSTVGLTIDANSGLVDASASTPGTYNVTYTTNGACPNTNVVSVNITTTDDASFSYNTTSACQSGTDPVATITGLTGGIFSSTAGLTIDANSGLVDVSTSTIGTYNVTYTTNGACPNTSVVSVVISGLDDPSYTYSAVNSCQNGTDLSTTITGLSGGTFTSTVGLSLNANSGLIDVSASAVGTYDVTYTTNGACPNTNIVSVTISATDNASFTYGGTTFCQNGTNATPTGGLPGGTWSSSVGLSLGASSGIIDVLASTPGVYTVTYTTNGTCPNSSSTSITITTSDNASYSYSATSSCQNGTDLSATVTGLTGGTFTSTAGLTLDANTGLIDVSTSAVGTYNVTYTTSGTCPNTSVIPVSITASDDASFTYGGSTFCQNATDPTVSVNLAGGTFTSTAGLVINSTTGLIDVSASTVGSYNVTYTTNGPCPAFTTSAVSITATGNSSFNYAAPTYCQNMTDPLATITGNPGGIFTSTAGLALDSGTGEITLGTSTPGTYTVNYAITGACPSSTDVVVTVSLADDASYSYNATSSCQNGTDLAATVTGLSGGTFTSTAGLTIDANTGLVDVSASAAGTYDVTYMTNGTCPNSSIISLTITATDNASFTYGGATFCQSAADPNPTFSTLGGTFTSTAGLVVNPSTGIIDVSASTPGTYNLTYTTNGTCPDFSTMTITITATGSSTFSYASTSFCQNAVSNPMATIGGNPGGLFTSTAGLIIDSNTGEINLAGSATGNYTITYAVSGSCPSSTDVVLTVLPVDVASFAFADTTVCQNIGANPILAVGGTTTGTYTASPVGLVFANNVTGEIDLTSSAIGNYVLTYTSNGACPVVVTANLDVSICGSLKTIGLTDSYKLYPNPNEGTFSIENNGNSGDVSIKVRDVLGRLIYTRAAYIANGDKSIFSISNIEGGSYFVEILKNGEKHIIKMIVQ